MQLFVGADHRGFALKEALKNDLAHQKINYIDCGASSYNPDDDAIDFVVSVVNKLKNPEDRGILMCGSGQAVIIVANRFPYIKAIMGFNEAVVEQGRNHDNANVLCLPAEHLSFKQTERMVDVFLHTKFSVLERYTRRQIKLDKLST